VDDINGSISMEQVIDTLTTDFRFYLHDIP